MAIKVQTQMDQRQSAEVRKEVTLLRRLLAGSPNRLEPEPFLKRTAPHPRGPSPGTPPSFPHHRQPGAVFPAQCCCFRARNFSRVRFLGPCVDFADHFGEGLAMCQTPSAPRQRSLPPKTLRHPNIVSFTEDFHWSKYICIVYGPSHQIQSHTRPHVIIFSLHVPKRGIDTFFPRTAQPNIFYCVWRCTPS